MIAHYNGTCPLKDVLIQTSKPTKLAKTGTNAGILAVLVPLVAASGAILYFNSRKEND